MISKEAFVEEYLLIKSAYVGRGALAGALGGGLGAAYTDNDVLTGVVGGGLAGSLLGAGGTFLTNAAMRAQARRLPGVKSRSYFPRTFFIGPAGEIAKLTKTKNLGGVITPTVALGTGTGIGLASRPPSELD